MKQQHHILIIVAAIIIAGGSFFGGTIYAKSGTRIPRGDQGVGMPMGRGMQGGGMMGGFTTGKIISSDDKSITVEMAANPNGAGGGSKVVFISDTMKVFKMTEGSRADLVPETSVTVTGTPNADGSLTAQSIQIRPEGTAMPFGDTLRMQGGNQPPSGMQR